MVVQCLNPKPPAAKSRTNNSAAHKTCRTQECFTVFLCVDDVLFALFMKRFRFPLVSRMDAQISCAWTCRLLYFALWHLTFLAQLLHSPHPQYRKTCVSSHALSRKEHRSFQNYGSSAWSLLMSPFWCPKFGGAS